MFLLFWIMLGNLTIVYWIIDYATSINNNIAFLRQSVFFKQAPIILLSLLFILGLLSIIFWEIPEERFLDSPKPFLTRPGFDDIKRLPNVGLYHSLEELEKSIDDPKIKTKSINYLAEYSDYVTRGSLNQDWFKRYFINTLPYVMTNSNYKIGMNTIGNIAYVCLKSTDSKLKSNACNILDLWRNNS